MLSSCIKRQRQNERTIRTERKRGTAVIPHWNSVLAICEAWIYIPLSEASCCQNCWPKYFCSQSTQGFVVVVTKQVLAPFLLPGLVLNPKSAHTKKHLKWYEWYECMAASFHLTTPVTEVTLRVKSILDIGRALFIYNDLSIHSFREWQEKKDSGIRRSEKKQHKCIYFETWDMTSLWPHQSRRWSHWGASNTPVLLYLCHTQCRTLWSLAPRQTSHIRSHMTYSTGPGEEDQRETCSKSSVLLCRNNSHDATETTKHVLCQGIHRLF